MRRKLALRFGTMAAAATLALGVAPAANAAFNLYQHDNYGGHYAVFNGSDVELNNKYWAGTTQVMQNGASSMRNQTNSYVGLWDIGGSCTGSSYTAKPNSSDSDFSNNNFDNKASCVKFL
ncbi:MULTISPECIES: peptidase inhibitor family I36 protein [Streptomyces]|uniref:Peptidase inhibitor family I36 protein n=1 Tax=Streptomyces cremeus TaxID=66881 RepID=A0ABV5PCQ4_STRCM